MTVKAANLILGVDTHKDFHHAAVISSRGQELGDREFPATVDGYRELIGWASSHGQIGAVGIEGTGSYGSGLTVAVQAAGLTVVDVLSPDRPDRRRRGKTDQLDAYSAARAVASGRSTTIPKDRDGVVEIIRIVHTRRKLLVKQRTETINQLQGILVTAPGPVRQKLAGLTGVRLVRACAGLRASTADDPLTAAMKEILRDAARQHQQLTATITVLRRQLFDRITAHAPELLALHGVGPDVAAALLIVAGQNSDRLGSSAALAQLTGTAPIPASSGKTHRHRLNRGGNRNGNEAFHRIVLVRMKSHPETRAYIERTLARGKTKRDAMRLVKRYLARQIYPALLLAQHRQNPT